MTVRALFTAGAFAVAPCPDNGERIRLRADLEDERQVVDLTRADVVELRDELTRWLEARA